MNDEASHYVRRCPACGDTHRCSPAQPEPAPDNPAVIHPGRCGDIEYDFFHRMWDVLVLLGAPPNVCAMVRTAQDKRISTKDLDELDAYCLSLLEAHKTCLSRINTIKVKPSNESGESRE